MTITGKEITKKEYEHQKQLNEIYFKKCQETGNIELLTKCKLIIEKDGKYYELQEKKMKNWDNLEYGDRLICKNDGSILQYIVYDMKKYLVSEKSMWLITEFDPNDWVKVDSK